MSKKRTALFVVAALGSVLVGAALFAYYDFTHNFRFPLTSEQVSDAQIAFKGAMGEAIFGGQRPEVVPDAQIEGKSGIDALLASVPGGNKSEGLIKAYQEDPQKFKRYAEMFDTAMNAKQVGDVLLRQAASHLPRTSESLAMAANLKVDAWGSPFCIIPIGARVAVVSGGPSRLSCNALPLTAEQIASSHRNMYAGPSDVLVVITERQDGSHSAPPRKTPTGS
ncbi:MAG: hypothetical protein ACRD23_03070 [Terriglobales bacterium]